MDEKKAILEIVRISKKLDITNKKAIKSILAKLSSTADFSQTQFGRRFLEALRAEENGNETRECVLCGKEVIPHRFICRQCLDNLGDIAEETVQAEQKNGNSSNETSTNEATAQPADMGADMNELKRDITAQLYARTKASDKYTEDLIKNLDASMDRLASRKALRASNRMLTAILVICLVNTISIIAIAAIIMRYLGVF